MAARSAQTGDVGPGRETPPSLPGETVLVPQDAETIQDAVDVAEPGGLVLIAPGVYHEEVDVTTPFLTIRGLDRNETILDGGFELNNAIRVSEADGVAIENLTARNYLENGFLWSGVFGYRGSYLTAYNNGAYGFFAFDSVYGQFDHSYASGHPDSGFYIGQCQPCHAVVTDVLAENNALGYSGTNAGGSLFVVNSEWRDNMAGIVPNTLDREALAPQRDAVIAGNWVHDNNNMDAPAEPLQYPLFGNGIAVTGGRDNLVTQNLVEDHVNFGIAILPGPDENFWLSESNEVRDNVVRSSGDADLALGGAGRRRRLLQRQRLLDEPSRGARVAERVRLVVPPDGRWVARRFDRPADSVPGGELGRPRGRGLAYAARPPPLEPMPGAAQAPPAPATPPSPDGTGGAVPQRIQIRDARTLDVPASSNVSQEVTVLGFPLATGWWGILIGLYAYALPLILYSAWISIALWDLVRQDAVPNGVRIAWMAGVIAVPVLGSHRLLRLRPLADPALVTGDARRRRARDLRRPGCDRGRGRRLVAE